MDRSGVQVLIFDVFGTVVDWRSGVAAHVGAWFGERGIDVDAFAFAEAWRDRYDPAMKRIRDGGRGYVALDILHMENLEETLQARDLEIAAREEHLRVTRDGLDVRDAQMVDLADHPPSSLAARVRARVLSARTTSRKSASAIR